MRLILYILVALSLCVSYGCSVFMPYNETFVCTVPEGQGYCGSLTDIYDYSVRTERGRLTK